MTFLDLAKERYSVRLYDQRPVEEEKIRQILEAGRLAPTAMNYQPQRIYLIKSEYALKKIRSITKHVYNAPLVMLICYDKDVAWYAMKTYQEDYSTGPSDASIVASFMMIQAQELGLGTLWARGFRTQDLIAAFDLPKNIIPVSLLLIGYPDPASKPLTKHFSRKDLFETVTEL